MLFVILRAKLTNILYICRLPVRNLAQNSMMAWAMPAQVNSPDQSEQEVNIMTMTDPNQIYFRKRIRVLSAIGPYLRETQCTFDCFFFDCLSVCIDPNVAPENREFLGWWLEMKLIDDECEYHYSLGVYNSQGQWIESEIPAQHKEEVIQSLHSFYEKLAPCMCEKLELKLKPSAVLDETQVLSAA